jgi:hypothetical protein
VHPSTARKRIIGGAKARLGYAKMPIKERIFKVLSSRYPSYKWHEDAQGHPTKESFDMSDSLVVSLYTYDTKLTLFTIYLIFICPPSYPVYT